MGILVLNTPVAAVTSTVPVNKDVQMKVFQIARTDVATSVRLVLPADATVMSILRTAGVASDAATTAAVTITIANNSGTVSTGSDNVKANGAVATIINMSGLPNVEPRPLTGDLTVSAVYAETGTPSTTGGPWTYIVTYVR